MGVGVITGVVAGKSGVTLLARVLGNLGSPITQASLASIAWTLTDLTAGAAVASGTFTIGQVVFDSLQLDPRWGVDTLGYNFLAVLAAVNFPAAVPTPGAGVPVPHRYQADVAFTPVSGEPFRVIFAFSALSVYG